MSLTSSSIRDRRSSRNSDRDMEEYESYRRQSSSSGKFSIPDIQVHMPKDETQNFDSRRSSEGSEPDVDYSYYPYSEQEDKYQSEVETRRTSKSSPEISDNNFSSTIMSLPDLNNFIVLPDKENKPSPKTSSSLNRSTSVRERSGSTDEASNNANFEKHRDRSVSSERKSSFLGSEMPSDRQRRKSLVDYAPFMEPRKSIIELTPAMQKRISIFEASQNNEMHDTDYSLDQEQKKSILGELSNADRRRSIRNEVLELERRYLSKNGSLDEDFDPPAKGESQLIPRRQSIRNEILAYERQSSIDKSEDEDFTTRRRSTVSENSDNDLEVVMRAEVTEPEKPRSIKKKIAEMERRKSIKENEMEDGRRSSSASLGESERRTSVESALHSHMTNILMYTDKEKSNTETNLKDKDDEDAELKKEDQYLKSISPYLKYRKSVSELHAYFEHQTEVNKLMSDTQYMIKEKENESKPLSLKEDIDRESYSDSDVASELEREWIVNEVTPNLGYKNSITDIIPSIIIQSSNDENEPQLINFTATSDNEYDDNEYESQRSSRSSGRDEPLHKSSKESLLIDEVDPGQDFANKRLSQHRKSIAMEVLEFLGRRISSVAMSDDERDESVHTASNENLSATNYPSSSRQLESPDLHDRARTPEIEKSSNLLSVDSAAGAGQRRKSIGLEILDFISRRLSNTSQDVDDNFLDTSNGIKEDYSQENLPKSPTIAVPNLASSSRKSSYAEQDRRPSGGSLRSNSEKSPRGSISASARAHNDVPTIQYPSSDEENEKWPGTPKGIELDGEESDLRRKSIGIDELNSLTRRLSDVQALNEEPEEEEYRRGSRKSSISLKEALRSPRGSISIEDARRSQRGSISRDPYKSPRGSVSVETANRSPRGSISVEADCRSSRGSISVNETRRSSRGSISVERPLRSPRGSISIEEDRRSSRGYNPVDGRLISPRGSISVEEAQRSHRGSISVEGKKSPRGSISVDESCRSPRGSISVEDIQKSRRGSISIEEDRRSSRGYNFVEEPPKSPRGSISREGGHISPRGSISVDESLRSPRGSISVEEIQRSPRGSISIEGAHMSPRGSISVEEGRRSARGSISIDDARRSPRGSISVEYIQRSPRGSISIEESPMSPRGSISVEEGRKSPRGSISVDESRRSSRGSISVEDTQRSPRGSISIEEDRRSSRYYNSAEEPLISPRGSISAEGGRRSPIGSISVEEAHKSLRGSPRGSISVEEGRRSARGSISIDDARRSPRGSISVEDGKKSHRGSMSVEEDRRSSRVYNFAESPNMSPRGSISRGSISAEVALQSPRGSISVEEGRRSNRGSISIDEARRSPRGSISVEGAQRSPRGSISVEEDRRSSKIYNFVEGPNMSPRGSLSRGSFSVDDARKTSRASSVHETQNSPRGSISLEEDRRSFKGSIQRKSISGEDSTELGDAQNSEILNLNDTSSSEIRRPSFSAGLFDFIARRFSSVSDTKDENDIEGQKEYSSPKQSPRSSSPIIDQNSADTLNTEEIIQYDQRRKSTSMDAIDFMVQRFSSEPIPDHQSKSMNDEDTTSEGEEILEPSSVENGLHNNEDDSLDIVEPEEKRKSVGMEILGFLSRRLSSTPGPENMPIIPSITVEEHIEVNPNIESPSKSRRSSRASDIENGEQARRASRGSISITGDHKLRRGSNDSQRSTKYEGDSESSRRQSMVDGDDNLKSQGSRRGSALNDIEDNRSRKGSVSSNDGRNSARGSISREGSRSQRNSMVVESGQSSRKGSVSQEDDQILRRNSALWEEGQRSRKGSISFNDSQKSPRGSISVNDSQKSPRGSISSVNDQGSRKGSMIIEGNYESRRGSHVSTGDNESRRGSTASKGNNQQSRRNSSYGEDDQRSRKGSIYVNENFKSPRGSITAVEEYQTRRGSQLTEGNRESRRGSQVSSGDHQSRRGSIISKGDQDLHQESLANESYLESNMELLTAEGDYGSRRGSRASEGDNKSRRESHSSEGNVSSRRGSHISEKDNESRRGSHISVNDSGSRRGSHISERDSGSRRGSHISEKDSGSRRGSYLDNSKRSPRGSISHENDQRSQRGSFSTEDNLKSPRGSISVDDRRSNRGSLTVDDQKSNRGSISVDDRRSSRGSISVDDRMSNRGSISVDKRRSTRGSISVDDRRSSRGSTSVDDRRSNRGSISVDEDFTSYSEYTSINDDTSRMQSEFSGQIRKNSQSTLSSEEYTEDFASQAGSASSLEDSMIREYIINTPSDSETESKDVTVSEFTSSGEALRSGSSMVQSSRKSFSENTQEFTEPGTETAATDSECESELNYDWEVNKSKSGNVSPMSIIESKVNLLNIQPIQNEMLLRRGSKAEEGEGEKYDLYEAIYGHIMTILTLPELGGEAYEISATFVPDVTLESSISDHDWNELSQKDKNITGLTIPRGLSPMPAIKSNGVGWTPLDAIDIGKRKKPIDSINTITFCGCGFLGGYLVGAAQYLQEHAPHLLQGRLVGSSVGSLIAACIACDIPLENVRKNILATAQISQKYFMGPFNPFFPIEEPLLKSLLRMIPEDGHIKASGRLFLSLTRATTLTNEIVSEYKSRDELVRALLCCCFLPFLSGFTVPTFQGRKYIDGGMSNNLPMNGPQTLTINAFSGNFDICPEDKKGYDRPLATAFNQSLLMNMDNFTRLIHALVPPKPEDLDKHYHIGYSDAQKYFPPETKEMRNL